MPKPNALSAPVFYLVAGLCFLTGVLLCPSLWMIPLALIVWAFLVRRWSLKPLRAALTLGLVYFVMLEAAVLLFMVRDWVRPEPIRGDETLIVPGAGLRGLEPDLYLKERLDGAVSLLKAYPDLSVIVSGWQAADELATEASVMKAYLVGQGIAAGRIQEEPRGYDTIRNLEYSKDLLEARGADKRVILVTSSFHSFRSAAIARALGLEPVSRPVPSPGALLLKYLVRETASLVKVQLHFGLSLR